MSKISYSIVVPCYNEEKNLPIVADRFRTALGDRRDIEVLLVENGSSDNSASVLRELAPTLPFARVISVKSNKGYGFGVLAGLSKARGQYLGWTHADVQTDPADAVRAFDLAAAATQPTFYKGVRQGRSLGARLFTAGMGLFASTVFRTWLVEINAQPTIFPREFFSDWKNPPHDFSIDLFAYVMAKRQRLAIRRLSVQFPDRLHGQSAWNTSFRARVRAITRTMKFCFELRRRLACVSSPIG